MTSPLLFFLALSIACSRIGSDATPLSHASAQATPLASSKAPSYSARGVIRAIEPEKQTVWIAHEDIPGYMKAMKMPFRASAALLAGVQVADSVEFSFHDDGDGNLVLEKLRKISQ